MFTPATLAVTTLLSLSFMLALHLMDGGLKVSTFNPFDIFCEQMAVVFFACQSNSLTVKFFASLDTFDE